MDVVLKYGLIMLPSLGFWTSIIPKAKLLVGLKDWGEYDFRIKYWVGTKHLNDDALSRWPCLLDNCNHCARLESRDSLHADNYGSCLLALSLPCTDIQASVAITSLVDLDKYMYKKLRVAQLQDLDIQPVLQWKKTATSRPSREDVHVARYSLTTKLYWTQWNSLKLDQGVLHRIWETPSGDRTMTQLILPRTLQKEAFHQLHSTYSVFWPLGSYMCNKTIDCLWQRLYQPGLQSDARKWCAECEMCASCRGPSKDPHVSLSTHLVWTPGERIAIDVLGPLPLSNSGNILLVVDYFTKWPEAYPLPN